MMLYLTVLFFINIHIFDYPDPRLFGLFRLVATGPDNRGSTVPFLIFSNLTIFSYCIFTMFAQASQKTTWGWGCLLANDILLFSLLHWSWSFDWLSGLSVLFLIGQSDSQFWFWLYESQLKTALFYHVICIAMQFPTIQQLCFVSLTVLASL